jgi:catechol 2,3-dioxygenase-like lactoylglutathione lyase family enzyme
VGGPRQIEAAPYEFNVGGVMLPRPFKINRLGPVHLFVRDVARSEAFYTGLLGLQKTEAVSWEGHRAVFLRHGTDHHTVALVPIELRERLGFSRETTLMSLGVELCSYQQLKDAAKHLAAAGLPPGPDIPHELLPGIDHHVGFQDPGGHNLLLYFSMEQVGWDGRPRPASERRKCSGAWPETIAAQSDTFATQTLLGPLA